MSDGLKHLLLSLLTIPVEKQHYVHTPSMHFYRLISYEKCNIYGLITITIAYMAQVDTDEKAALQEQVAWKELRDGTEQYTAIPELLKKLSRPNEINLYYCGGLELLSRAIKDCKFTRLILSPSFLFVTEP